jgi:hypothetical protein
MWRREERLEYWLRAGRLSEKPGRALRLGGRKLSLRFWLWQFPSAVREQSLSLVANAISLDGALSATACVRDGLGRMGPAADGSGRAAYEGDEPLGTTHGVDLLGDAFVRDLKLPNEQNARIQRKELAIHPNFRSLSTSVPGGSVHTEQLLPSRPAEVKDGDRLFALNSAVGILPSQISQLPHMRRSLNVGALQDSERRSYLHEAEALKGVPAHQAELLAVFRHVPIEMISRLRFLADKRVILYSICSAPKRTQTRVHDLAAVRNAASQEIYLIPHRARFRSVPLN